MSDSLQPHEPQHARPPCPSPVPGACSNSCPSIGDAIQPSHPLLSPSPLALNISQHQGLFEIFLLEVSYCQMHRKQNKEVILLTHFQGQTIVTYDAI